MNSDDKPKLKVRIFCGKRMNDAGYCSNGAKREKSTANENSADTNDKQSTILNEVPRQKPAEAASSRLKRTATFKRPGFNYKEISNGCKGLNFDDEKRQSRSMSTNCDQEKRKKFSVSLSLEEINEDYMKMFGHRAPRHTKKREKVVQDVLDNTFPGLNLLEVRADMYKVQDSGFGKKAKDKI